MPENRHDFLPETREKLCAAGTHVLYFFRLESLIFLWRGIFMLSTVRTGVAGLGSRGFGLVKIF